eukprot:261672_1
MGGNRKKRLISCGLPKGGDDITEGDCVLVKGEESESTVLLGVLKLWELTDGLYELLGVQFVSRAETVAIQSPFGSSDSNEVFLTQTKMKVSTENIVQRCRIVNHTEFVKLRAARNSECSGDSETIQENDDLLFFCREEYIPKRKQFRTLKSPFLPPKPETPKLRMQKCDTIDDSSSAVKSDNMAGDSDSSAKSESPVDKQKKKKHSNSNVQRELSFSEKDGSSAGSSQTGSNDECGADVVTAAVSPNKPKNMKKKAKQSKAQNPSKLLKTKTSKNESKEPDGCVEIKKENKKKSTKHSKLDAETPKSGSDDLVEIKKETKSKSTKHSKPEAQTPKSGSEVSGDLVEIKKEKKEKSVKRSKTETQTPKSGSGVKRKRRSGSESKRSSVKKQKKKSKTGRTGNLETEAPSETSDVKKKRKLSKQNVDSGSQPPRKKVKKQSILAGARVSSSSKAVLKLESSSPLPHSQSVLVSPFAEMMRCSAKAFSSPLSEAPRKSPSPTESPDATRQTTLSRSGCLKLKPPSQPTIKSIFRSQNQNVVESKQSIKQPPPVVQKASGIKSEKKSKRRSKSQKHVEKLSNSLGKHAKSSHKELTKKKLGTSRDSSSMGSALNTLTDECASEKSKSIRSASNTQIKAETTECSDDPSTEPV